MSWPCQRPGTARGHAAHLHHEQSFTSKRSRSFSIVFLRGGTGESAEPGRGSDRTCSPSYLILLSPTSPHTHLCSHPASFTSISPHTPLPSHPSPLNPGLAPAFSAALTRCPRRTRRSHLDKPPRCVCCACGRHGQVSGAGSPPPTIPSAPQLTGPPRTRRRVGGGASGALSQRARS